MASNSIIDILSRNEGKLVGLVITAITILIVRKQFGSLGEAARALGKGAVNAVGGAVSEVQKIGAELVKPGTDWLYDKVTGGEYTGEVELTGAAVALMPSYFDSSGRMLESRYTTQLAMHSDNARLFSAVMNLPARTLKPPYSELMKKHGGILIDNDLTVIADGKKVHP